MTPAPEVPAGAVTPPAPPCGSRRDPTTGQFTRGDATAATHWLTSDRLPPALEHLRAEVRWFLDAAIEDDGGASEVPVRRRALLEYRSRLHRRIVQLDAAIELRGLFDKRNKLRAGWLSLLSTLIEKARALDTTLGLERRPRRLNVAEQLAQFHGGRRPR